MRITFNPIATIYPTKKKDIKKDVLIKQNAQTNPINNSFNIRVSYPLVFGAKRCSVANFKVKELKNLRCPVCGQTILNEEQQMTFVNSIFSKRGEELIKGLEVWEDERNVIKNSDAKEKISLFRHQEQQIVDVIKNLAKENPNLYLNELVSLEAKRCLENLIKDQLEIVSELEKYIQENVSSDSELIHLKEIIEEQKKQIKGESTVDFKRKKFIYALSATVSDNNVQNKINEIAKKLPNSTNDINSFFVKYSNENKTSRDIAYRLIHQANPTAEHLRPKSKGGPDAMPNYICDCTNCNEKRGNISFYDWQKTVPNFQQKLQEYLEDVQKALDEERLPSDYDNYISDVIGTISTLSKGEIVLNLPSSTNQVKIQQVLTKRKDELDYYNQIINEKIRKRKEKKKELNALESYPHYRTIIQYQTIIGDVQDLEIKIESTKNQLSKTNSPKLEKELESLIQEKTNLERKKELIGKIIDKLISFEKPIEEAQKLYDNALKIDRQIQELESEISLIDELEKDLEYLDEEITKTVQRTKRLFEQGYGKNKDDYNKLLEMKSLIARSEIMLNENRAKKKNSAQKETEKIIQIARESLNASVSVLKEEPSVEFFLNVEDLKKLNKSKIDTKLKIDSLIILKRDLEVKKREFKLLTGNKTLEELKNNLESLKEKQETVEKILNLKELRAQYSILEDEISYNLKILNNLRKTYRTLSNKEFREEIDTLYLKD